MAKQPPITFEQLPQVVSEILERICDIQLRLDNYPEEQESFPELLNTSQAAEFLQIAKPTLYNLVSSRKIPHTKKGKHLRFYRAELISWNESGRRPTSQAQKVQVEQDVDAMLSASNRKTKR